MENRKIKYYLSKIETSRPLYKMLVFNYRIMIKNIEREFAL